MLIYLNTYLNKMQISQEQESFYSEYNYGFIGENIRDKILPLEKKIRRYQRILSQKQNDKKIMKHKIKKIKKKTGVIKNKKNPNVKINNKQKIIKKIRSYYEKIRNIVKELHNKTALFLVKNYNKIMLPKFETQNMIRKRKYTKDYFNKMKEKEGEDKTKKEIRNVYKKRRLNGRVKFVLNSLSHYKFKMHLLNKCKEYGSELIEVTEEYTSKTCTNCGCIGDEYTKKRDKICKCNYKINRDINGARNIFIKNIKQVAKPRATIEPKER